MSTPEEDNNLAIVKSAFAASAKGDWQGFMTNLTDTTEFHQAPSLPYGGVYYGLKDIQRIAKLVFESWGDFSYEVVQFAAGGDRVFILMYVGGTGKAAGKRFSMPAVEVWRLKEGSVTEIRPIYFDTHRVVECFG